MDNVIWFFLIFLIVFTVVYLLDSIENWVNSSAKNLWMGLELVTAGTFFSHSRLTFSVDLHPSSVVIMRPQNSFPHIV